MSDFLIQNLRYLARTGIQATAGTTAGMSDPNFSSGFNGARGSGLQMPNGFGAIQDASALCVVQDDRIKELAVNGTIVVSR